eukprot:gene7548-18072_t
MVFAAAARSGLPTALWVPQWRSALAALTMANGVVYQGGGGLEVAGAAQGINDMLLQSSGGYVSLFPAWDRSQPASFARLRAKGAFVVSAAWDPQHGVVPPITVVADVGGELWVEAPEGWRGGRRWFGTDTAPGVEYLITPR